MGWIWAYWSLQTFFRKFSSARRVSCLVWTLQSQRRMRFLAQISHSSIMILASWQSFSSLLMASCPAFCSFSQCTYTLWQTSSMPVTSLSICLCMISTSLSSFSCTLSTGTTLWEDAIGAQEFLLGFAVDGDVAVVLQAADGVVGADEEGVGVEGVAEPLAVALHLADQLLVGGLFAGRFLGWGLGAG